MEQFTPHEMAEIRRCGRRQGSGRMVSKVIVGALNPLTNDTIAIMLPSAPLHAELRWIILTRK
jgi:hypothetical protein